MAIEKKMIPVAPWRGLYLDGVTVPGGLSKAENVIILPDGTAERRLYERSLTDTETCLSGRGAKRIFELKKNDGTRYVFADIDNSETSTASFSAEQVSDISGWSAPAAAAWGTYSAGWTHVAGNTTALVATMGTAITASTLYRVVTDVTCPTIYGSGSNWTYAHTDSTYDWTTKEGNTKTVWLNTWTHAAGSTVALNASKDFSTVVGASYVVKLHVTHTSGTGLTVYCGGITAGTIASSGYHTFIVRYCTDTTGLRLAPSSDWVGSINKTYPRVPNLLDNWCSVVKLVDPAGDNTPSNYDYTESTHIPKSMYLNGAELLYFEPTRWYVEADASVSQSVSVYVGNTLAGVISASGQYSYDVTSTNTDALKYVPTSNWTGTVTTASVKKMTQGAAATKTKVIGGTVTGTTDYEVTWANILTDLTSGSTVHPQWTTLQDRAYRVDGTNQNYFFEDASAYYTLGCPAPEDAPVTSDTTGGELLAGTYNVYYTWVKKYTDSYVVEGNPSPASNTVVTNNAINVTVKACTEDDVTHIRVYRTLYGEPGSYAYYCGEWVNETATIKLTDNDDNIRDTLSTLEFDHDMPPLGKFVLGAGSRLWLIDTDGTLHWSVLDKPELMPSMNYTTFDPKDGDEMMGMCPLRKHLLVFKRRRTWLLDMFSQTVSDDGVAALSKDVVSSNYGCIATGSIQSVGTDSAIWLSHAGFILYNGGSIKNISGGGVDADGNMMPSRIQSVINNFMANSAEHFISSAYHSASQLYHVNFLYYNSGGDTITSQRHFVYNLASDTWTEFVYRNSSGTKLYETTMAIAHDSLGNEVILIPYILTTTGTTTYVYQGAYNPANTDYTVGAFNATGQTDREWHGMCSDENDNVYAVEWQGDIYKNTGGIDGTFTALGETSRYWSGIAVNNDNGNVYACTYETYDGGFTGGDVYMQTAGSGTFDSLGLHAMDEYWTGIAIDSSGNVYACSYGTNAPGTASYIYKQTAGTGDFESMGGTARDWYGITVTPSDEIYACVYGGDIYKYDEDTETFEALGQTSRNWSSMASDSDGNVYAAVYGGYVYKQTAGTGDFEALDSTSKVWGGAACISDGAIFAANFGNGSGEDIYVYLPEGYWEEKSDTITSLEVEPTLTNTVVHIVSNYNDLGAPNEKRICGVYLPVQSEYASCGSVSIEPDYGVNVKTHTEGESSQPSGSVSMRPIAHPGEQAWTYTNSAFDSTVENWKHHRVDIGYRGKAFRYAIRMGDMEGANPGDLRIKPPYMDVQILTKQ